MTRQTPAKSNQFIWVLQHLALASCLGCAATSRPSPDSETHWLRRCTADIECGSLECLCGVCSVVCDTDSECNSSVGERASCDTPAEHDVRCAELRPDEAVCVPTCIDQSCAMLAGSESAKREGVERTSMDALAAWPGEPSLCFRPGDDAVRDVFCGPSRPEISGLADLQRALYMDLEITAYLDPGAGLYMASDHGGATPAIGLVLGLSTAPSGHVVSPINPRALLLTSNTSMAFQRGVQQVEIIVLDRINHHFTFYLLNFVQACNGSEDGCRPGDLYTPAIESDWTGVTVRDDEDLKNTPSDCRQCHQRGRDKPVLLMRELETPWTHFFSPPLSEDSRARTPGVRGGDLLLDYRRARGDESLAGMNADVMDITGAGVLAAVVDRQQPLVFDAPTIEGERWPWGPGFPESPLRSATWDAAYAAFKRGEQQALPHYQPRPTDPAKQARLTAAYASYRKGELPAAELPDLADIFPDDPHLRAEIGLQTEPDATPVEALIQACGSCHNDVLDQSISRARFNIALDRMDGAALELAIERIELPSDDPAAMPPKEARQVPPDVRDALVGYLARTARPEKDLARLRRAAELGMKGNGVDPLRADQNTSDTP